MIGLTGSKSRRQKLMTNDNRMTSSLQRRRFFESLAAGCVLLCELEVTELHGRSSVVAYVHVSSAVRVCCTKLQEVFMPDYTGGYLGYVSSMIEGRVRRRDARARKMLMDLTWLDGFNSPGLSNESIVDVAERIRSDWDRIRLRLPPRESWPLFRALDELSNLFRWCAEHATNEDIREGMRIVQDMAKDASREWIDQNCADWTAFRGCDWAAVPEAGGVYLIYDQEELVYVGCAAGSGASSLRVKLQRDSSSAVRGFRGQLLNGVFAQSLFFHRVQHELAEPVARPQEAYAACGSYIAERCSFSYSITQCVDEARALEDALKVCLKPTLDGKE
jgi:hypothetical protein